MTKEEMLMFALDICDEADVIIFNVKIQFIQWQFNRNQNSQSFNVGVFIDDKFNKKKFQSDLTTLLLHSHYDWN